MPVVLCTLKQSALQAACRGAAHDGVRLEESLQQSFLFCYVYICFFVSWLPLLLFCLSICCLSLCVHLTPDLKLCPIPMTPNGHLDPSLPLGGHLGPSGAADPAARLSLQPDPMLMALDSRKSSVMSLGRMSYDQRSLVSPVGCSGWVLLGGGRETVWPKPGRGAIICPIPGCPVPDRTHNKERMKECCQRELGFHVNSSVQGADFGVRHIRTKSGLCHL